jgi:hypothetical protein
MEDSNRRSAMALGLTAAAAASRAAEDPSQRPLNTQSAAVGKS